MEKLWAPWRMEYILSGEEAAEECIFCRFPAEGPEHHQQRYILYADAQAFVILNKFPYNNGHLMVVPRAHVANLNELAEADFVALSDLLRGAVEAMQRALAPQGMNIGMNLGRVAGAGIDAHCHWHVVPRWNGDTNFMPVIGEAKVMSEHLDATYQRLLPHFAQLPKPHP